MKNTIKVVTGKVRFSYLHVFEPYAHQEGVEKKYSASILIPKNDKKTIKDIQDAIKSIAESAKAGFGGKLPAKYKLPMNDGDIERSHDDTYTNVYYLNASSKVKPGIVDAGGNPILDKDEFYSGCYGRASITLYSFDVRGNRGIACWLNNLQKLEDGERLDKSNPALDFAKSGSVDFL